MKSGKLRRQAVWERMQELATAVQARNQDLSPEESEQIADNITRETIDRMTKEGKISFVARRNTRIRNSKPAPI